MKSHTILPLSGPGGVTLRWLIIDPLGREVGILRDQDAALAALRSLDRYWAEESLYKGEASARDYAPEES
jgi:hypothetical protein